MFQIHAFSYNLIQISHLPLLYINWPYPLSRIRYDRLALSSEPVTLELRVLIPLS